MRTIVQAQHAYSGIVRIGQVVPQCFAQRLVGTQNVSGEGCSYVIP
jgi:hypothetical protein